MRSPAKKCAARDRRRKRRDLVHATGCTEPRCCVRREAFDHVWMVNEACADNIRIPRSLERRWAR